MEVKVRDELVTLNESRNVYYVTLPDSTTVQFRGPSAEKAAAEFLKMITPAEVPPPSGTDEPIKTE